MSKLTVGIPVFNGMPYLRESMESLFAQKYSDFQILVIIDGSDDGSAEYLSSLRDSRLRVVPGPRNGLIAALNTMLDVAETEWLVRQDADDVSYPERLATIVRNIETYPHTGVFFSAAEYYPTECSLGAFRSSRGTPEQLRSVVESGYLLAICHPSTVLNIARVRKLGGYQEGSGSEDSDLWWRVALEYDIRFIPETLVGYRLHANSKMTKALRRDAISGLYVQYRLLSRLWAKTPRSRNEVEGALASLLDERRISAKERLRAFNMFLNEGKYLAAASQFCSAVATSPAFVARRIQDELSPRTVLRNGVPPSLFLRIQDQLW